MEEIRWGIIGCGDVTELKSGPAFNKVSHSKLAAVMRRNAEKAEDYAKRHGVKKWYDNATALIDDPEINAIYIATPPLQHEAYTLQALAAGKPVYVEKPMTLNADAAKRMSEAAKSTNTKLVVAHYRRMQPMFLKIKSLLEESTIGDIRLINLQMLRAPETDLVAKTEGNWRINPSISGGGLFHDLAPHQLDLMSYYFGAIKNISGLSVSQATPNDVDDLVVGQLIFENGAVFTGTWCFNVGTGCELDKCTIYGSKGTISFPMFGNQIVLTIDGEEEILTFDALQHVQQPMIAEVVRYFRDETENPCSGEEAVVTMEIMDRFTRK